MCIRDRPNVFFELLDYSAVAFEMVPFICLLLGKRYWIAWCAVACSFHAGTALMLNIAFPYQLFGYLPFLIPIWMIGKVRINQQKLTIFILIAAFYRTAAIWTESCPLIRDVLLPTQLTKLYFDLFVWIGLTLLGAYCALKSPTSDTSDKADR